MTEPRFKKRPPRLDRIFQTIECPVYFITFLTHRRDGWLANEGVHLAFVAFAERAHREFNVAVGRYVLMPDHVHLFVAGDRGFDLGRWVGMLRQCLARSVGRRKTQGQIWQEGFFDHLLRNDESMSQKWEYVRQNPVRAGLVATAESWPYQGEIVRIDRA